MRSKPALIIAAIIAIADIVVPVTFLAIANSSNSTGDTVIAPGPFPSTGPTITVGPTPTTSDITLSSFVGMTEEQGKLQAATDGYTTRVIIRDGTSYPVTADYSENRLNFIIQNGKITGVQQG